MSLSTVSLCPTVHQGEECSVTRPSYSQTQLNAVLWVRSRVECMAISAISWHIGYIKVQVYWLQFTIRFNLITTLNMNEKLLYSICILMLIFKNYYRNQKLYVLTINALWTYMNEQWRIALTMINTWCTKCMAHC